MQKFFQRDFIWNGNIIDLPSSKDFNWVNVTNYIAMAWSSTVEVKGQG